MGFLDRIKDLSTERAALQPAPGARLGAGVAGMGDPEIQAMNAEAPLLELIQQDASELGHDCGGYIKFDACPVCGHTDCLRYYHNTNSWTCFGANNTTGKSGGGYSDYLMAAHQMNSTEAIEELRRVTGHLRAKPTGKPAKAARHAEAQAKQPAKFDHTEIADTLINERHAAFPDDIPVIWDAGSRCYVSGRDAMYNAMIDERRNITKNQRSEVFDYLQLRAPRPRMAEPKYIAFSNGVLDLDSMELREASPELIIPNTIPHKWSPSAECAELDAAIEQWACHDDGRATNIRETIGLCMYRGRDVTACPVLVGRGANGKSTFLNFLREVVGQSNTSGLNLSGIGRRFQSIALMGKLANICDDLSNAFVDGELMENAKKAITGDEVGAEYKGGATFSFRPYCRFVFAANEIPRMGDSSHGTFRRFVPIKFEARFSASEGTAVTKLEQTLSTEVAYERAIVIGVTALRGCIERGCMTPTQDQRDVLELMRQQNSSVFAYLQIGLDGDYTKIIDVPVREAFNNYRAWCGDSGYRDVAIQKFSQQVCEELQLRIDRTREFGKQQRVFRVKRDEL